MKSAIKEGFCKRFVYFSIREGLKDTSAEIWGVKVPAKQRPGGRSLPSTESSPGKGRETGENWGEERQFVWRKHGRETQLEKSTRNKAYKV